jgi:hypothetical protein
MASQPQTSVNELLKHFDKETATRLAQLVNGGSISADHLKEIVRLTSALPDYRDSEELDSLLEDAQDMDIDAFRAWVEQILKESKEG